MCGIAGYISCNNNSFSSEYLESMQRVLVHRGPDGYDTWSSSDLGIGFTHRRLSIVDLSEAGKQPMLSKDGSVVITFNGEIYNHLLLRKELEALGYSYFSNTDTETLLYAYKEWGIAFLEKLEGMFAFVLFDRNKNELYCVRDRIGIKPLYFSLAGNFISFASEIKALWQLPWLKKEINDRALYHYLTFMATPAPLTLYKSVYKLPAGFYMKVSSNRDVTFHEWYSPITSMSEAEEKQFQNEEFCIENVRSLLRESIKKRMMSDVPFGVFLSGGIDSSLNVALMSEYTSHVKTFNVSFSDGPEHSEVQWARKVAQRFDTDHHEISISEKEAADFFEKMVYHQDEPLADCVCVPLHYVAKLAKDSGVTVVQVGEGADELFCGYAKYAQFLDTYNKYWKPTQNIIPAFARRGVAAIFPLLKNNIRYHEMIKNWATSRNFFWGGAVTFYEMEKKLIYSQLPSLEEDFVLAEICKGMSQGLDSYTFVDYHLSKLRLLDSKYDFLKSMIYLELKHRLPELLLMRVDKMTMATSIEARVPFLDHKLVEFALNVPTKFKYKNGVTKYILKKVCEGILPNDVIYRKKVGFGAPVDRWIRGNGPYKSLLSKQFDSEHSLPFNSSYLEMLLKDHVSGKNNNSPFLWVIHNLLSAVSS